MIIKPTGRSVRSAKGTVNYLGTAGDKTRAHNNPGLRKYREARQMYNRTGLNEYRQQMMKYKVFTRRDLMTFGNFDTSSTKRIKYEIKKFMSHNNRKVQSREFAIMPSDSDNVSANNPTSIWRFAKFVHHFTRNHFKDNFHYYVDIQPDSHTNSRVHAHLVVINDNLITHRAMAGHYYNIKGKHGLWDDLRTTAHQDGYSIPSQTITPHTPTPMESHVIGKARRAFQALQSNPSEARKVTSQNKFIAYMARFGIKANYRNTTRHYKKRTYHVKGWKFKLASGRHAYIKASRLSKAKGGEFMSTNNIASTLSSDRKLNARMKQKARAPQSSATQSELAHAVMMKKIYSAVDAEEPTPSSTAPSASSSDSSVDNQKTSKASSNVENQANKEEREAQQSELMNQQRLEAIRAKKDKAKKTARARHERKMNHERRFNEEFKAMAEINQRQHQSIAEQAEEAEPMPRPYATADRQLASQRRTDTSRQKATGRAGRFIDNLRRQGQRTKHVYIQAKIAQAKRRVVHFVNEQVEKVKKTIKRQISRVRNRITQRDHQREADHKAKQQNKNRQHWAHEQGGIERD